MNYLRMLATTRRHPCAVLLGVQLLGILAYPFAESTPAGQMALSALGVVVLLVTVRMVRRTPGLLWISIGLAVPIMVLLALQGAADMPHLLPWSAALEAVFYFYATGSLIAYMLADRKATLDELFAVGATFTLLAWAFTHLFVLTQALQPGCFLAAVNPQAPRSWSELMYLSFALLSSTGIGDVIPVTVHARALASVAMFVGVMYLAMVVSRLIGLTLQPTRP
ncbi:MAG: two pore domain potassium channel family protein [Variovorax sp.]|nr:MAG: two pore domain potassium channel family protein [Variovorax sp.]